MAMRDVAVDFSDIYLGCDIKFVRTFWILFKNAEKVITGYITGRRTAYLDAVQYLLVALFVIRI
jgi:hypothetical protein